MIYADYNYYKHSYLGDQIKAEGFGQLAKRSSEYIDYVTMGRAQLHAEENKIRDACCALAEQFHIIDLAAKAAADGGVVESETVGPHSVHYASPSDAAKVAQKELYQVAQRYLWPYMYRGVAYV